MPIKNIHFYYWARYISLNITLIFILLKQHILHPHLELFIFSPRIQSIITYKYLGCAPTVRLYRSKKCLKLKKKVTLLWSLTGFFLLTARNSNSLPSIPHREILKFIGDFKYSCERTNFYDMKTQQNLESDIVFSANLTAIFAYCIHI